MNSLLTVITNGNLASMGLALPGSADAGSSYFVVEHARSRAGVLRRFKGTYHYSEVEMVGTTPKSVSAANMTLHGVTTLNAFFHEVLEHNFRLATRMTRDGDRTLDPLFIVALHQGKANKPSLEPVPTSFYVLSDKDKLRFNTANEVLQKYRGMLVVQDRMQQVAKSITDTVIRHTRRPGQTASSLTLDFIELLRKEGTALMDYRQLALECANLNERVPSFDSIVETALKSTGWRATTPVALNESSVLSIEVER